MIHRDIKPHNILITESGDVKVTDFGIARAASSSTMTHTGSILGTAHYISPEQAMGEPGARRATSTLWASSSTRCSPASCPTTRIRLWGSR